MKARVFVTLKPGVLDPQGKAIHHALEGLGFAGVQDVRAGKLKAIAVTQPKRHPGLPDTPTFAEAGHPGVAMDAYFGMVAPAGTPRPVIDRLNREIVAILKEKETLDRFQGAGLDVVGSTPEQFSARIKADLEKFAKVAKSLGAKAE